MNKINLSKKDFEKLAKLSNLYPSEEESDVIRGQLSEALNSMDVLAELDTQNTKPLNHPTGDLVNVYRQDRVEPSLTQDQALSGAKSTHDGYFMVNAIFDNEDN